MPEKNPNVTEESSTPLSPEELIDIGRVESSKHPFVKKVGFVKIPDEFLKEEEVQRVLRPVQRTNNIRGFGYLSSSQNFDPDKELLWAAIISRSFRANNAFGATPLIIPIDTFYTFRPGILSLVDKTKMFNLETKYSEEIKKQFGEHPQFILILTGLTDSMIFNQQVLDQVPHQINAGLSIESGIKSPDQEFTNKLGHFYRDELAYLFTEKQGRVDKVLERLAHRCKTREDANLLLIAGLLLQDRQRWQNLWYENQAKGGTPLYIIAPYSFHQAMNRLNIFWGHGSIDYHYRASCSLGAYIQPPGEDIPYARLEEQGLSFEEFSSRVTPYLG